MSYWDNGKYNGNYDLGFRVQGIPGYQDPPSTLNCGCMAPNSRHLGPNVEGWWRVLVEVYGGQVYVGSDPKP